MVGYLTFQFVCGYGNGRDEGQNEENRSGENGDCLASYANGLVLPGES